MASLESYWSANEARRLTPNGRYLFVVVAPSEIPTPGDAVKVTDQVVQKMLEAKGWEVVSTGAPPEELASNITALSKKLKEIQNLPAPPIALKVIGIWRGAESTLPPYDGTFIYGPIATWFTPDGPAKEDPRPAPAAMQWAVVLGAGAALVGLVYLLGKPKIMRLAAENPVRYVNTVIHNGVSIHVHKSDDGYCADFAAVLRRVRDYRGTTTVCGRDHYKAIDAARRQIDLLTQRAA